MERIIYRKTLDVHKAGVQFTLQGFQTADKMARTLELSLMASGDTIDLPLEQLMAVMYVTTPNAAEPSINQCTIKDNTVVCNIPTIVEEGITEIQIKLIETRLDGANGVLATPKFAIEVSKSNTNEDSAVQNTTFTALEQALAQAKGVYDSRVTRVVLSPDCIFTVHYADGTVYTSDALKDIVVNGESLVSKSYARGGTGIRDGEDTDNAMYYSNVSKSESLQSSKAREESEELLEEVKRHSIHTEFTIDFETGTIKYASQLYSFNVNEETGELDVIGDSYTPNANIEQIVTDWLEGLYVTNDENLNEVNSRLETAEINIDNANARIFATESTLLDQETTLTNQITRLDKVWDWSNLALARVEKCESDIGFNEQYIENIGNVIQGHSETLENHTSKLNSQRNTLDDHTSRLSEHSTKLSNIAKFTLISGTTTTSGNLVLTTNIGLIPICCLKTGYIITPYYSTDGTVLMAHVSLADGDLQSVGNKRIEDIAFYYIKI